jgi:hypothetical protein
LEIAAWICISQSSRGDSNSHLFPPQACTILGRTPASEWDAQSNCRKPSRRLDVERYMVVARDGTVLIISYTWRDSEERLETYPALAPFIHSR